MFDAIFMGRPAKSCYKQGLDNLAPHTMHVHARLRQPLRRLACQAALGAAAIALWGAAGLAQAQTYLSGSVAGQLAPGV